MMSERLAVEIYVCRGVGTAYFKEITVGFGKLGLIYLFGVKRFSAEVIVVSVLTVYSVPGMGKVNEIPFAVNSGRDSICLL